jgi:hypothetical protein
MARARSWFTKDHAAGSVGNRAYTGTTVIATALSNPTLLRTRAFASLASVATEAPPFTPGNAHAAQVFRVVITPEDSPPDISWTSDPEFGEDVVFSSLLWQTGLYVPASADMTRPEETYCVANISGEVADSHGERKMLGTVNVLASWYAGPVLEDVQPADPEFTVNWWIRCLIEADI